MYFKGVKHMLKFISVILVINLVLNSLLIGCATKVGAPGKATESALVEQLKELKKGDCIKIHLRSGRSVTGILTSKGAETGYIRVSRAPSGRGIFVDYKKIERIPFVDVVRIDRYPLVVYELRGCGLDCLTGGAALAVLLLALMLGRWKIPLL